ncbi:MAG TPA: RNA methyltransferase [Acidimicrobiales bacterium]|nr:RNA methyltransferase [Acidimicrobiales bacterium]
MIIEVSSVDDPRLVDYASLNNVETRREVERRGSFFIAESELVIRELVRSRSRWPIRSVLVTPKRFEAMRDVLEDLDAAVFVGAMDVVREVTGFHIHRGAVASAERGPLPAAADVLRGASRAVVLEGVSDHENIGSIFRSAAAFGFDAVLLDAACADPLYRRSVRVSMGHILHVPFARVSSLDEVRAAGLSVLALTPSADAVPLDEVAAAPPARCALVLGAEHPGLSASWLAAADRRVRIPIAAGVDSLNVSVAAAVAMHRLAMFPSATS